MADDSTDRWGMALRDAGLTVRDVGSSSLMLDEPGAFGQFVDEATGAVHFALLGDVGTTEEGPRLVRVVSRGRGRLTAPSWERDFRSEHLRWFRHSDRDVDAQSATVDLDGLARLSVGPSLLLLHDWLGRTDSDFSALDGDLHELLSDRYEGRLLGYDHHTLCVEPAQNAQALGAMLSRLKRELVLDVVGIGRGGLVARELAERRQFPTLSIDKVITVGTPHTGTPLADRAGLLAFVNRFVGSGALAPDMMRGVASVLAHVVDDTAGVLTGLGALGVEENTSLKSLNALSSPPGIRYFMIAGTLPGWKPTDASPTGEQAVEGESVDDEPNDGFVTVRSALARTVDGGHIRDATSDDVAGRHDELLAASGVRERLHSWLFASSPRARPADNMDRAIVHKGTATTVPSRDVRPVLGANSTEGESGSTTEQPQDLTISLLHASLEHAGDTVLVGHFAGSPLTGAEERLDDCLDHRLSRAQVGRDYPEAFGEFRHFPGDDQTRPAGAIVVGLGPAGELTPSRLTTVVTRAIVRYASEQRDRERVRRNAMDEPFEPLELKLPLSSVLIGTSRSSGLTVEGSVRAIVAGVVFANRRLRPNREGTGGLTDSVTIFKLTFVERYEDSVELAAQALELLKSEGGQTNGGDGVTFVATPRSREGAAGPNPPSDTANAVWTRVSIQQSPPKADGLSELTYSMMARMARAEQVTHRVDQALVDSLVGQSINRTADPRIGSTLYELLLPHDLKQPIGSGSHLQLLVDETTADYPYELLTPREEAFRSSRPLAVSAGLLRQFVENRDRRHGPARAAGPTALIIGNPPAGPNFASLWGAHSEALEVANAFSAAANPQWEVTARIWDGRGGYVGTPIDDRSTTDPAENVVHELLTGAWRVVHIAAHGSIQGDGDTANSGVVLSEDRRLSPVTIGQLSIVPDLVVVNACHLGAITRQLAGMNRVAASLARSLMRIGVRAVIVAGWAVDDQAAAMFANVLYDELLAGRELGDALLLARSQVHRADDGGLTWGAYQAYGDPGFRLAPRRQARGGSGPSLTVSELRRRIRATAGTASDRTSSVSSLRRAITAVGDAASESLGVGDELEAQLLAFERDQLYVTSSRAVQADISADLAVAWTELGHFDRAVRHYRRSLRGGGKSVPTAALEQLANLSMRWAARRENDRLRRKLVADALRWLAAVDALGRNAERLALRGSFHKKRASLTTPPNQEDIEIAAEMYRAAHELDSRRRAARAPKPQPGVRVPVNTYFEFNARQLTAIARLANTSIPEMTVDDTGWSADEVPMDFWERNAIGDWMLTKLVEIALDAGSMQDGSVPPTVEQLQHKYRDAFMLRSSAANRSSVTENLYDIADLLPDHIPLKKQLRAAASTLRTIDNSPVRPSRRVDDGAAVAP